MESAFTFCGVLQSLRLHPAFFLLRLRGRIVIFRKFEITKTENALNDLGYHALVIALVLNGYSAILALIAARRAAPWMLTLSKRALYAAFALVTLSSSALMIALLSRDFRLEYVAHYSNRSLSLFYTAASFWAGQAGSLLFWALLLSAFSVIVVWQNRERNPSLLPYIITVMSFTSFFFLYLLVAKSNPFLKSPILPADGTGLNPLLQNPEMIFHPPSLYVGFVGFTVPFAFAIAALVTKKLDEGWIRSIRRWTLFSWLFLTIGNLLGMQWAYVELGWGGYWGWDPVENSSLLPWLTGTAFLHSIIVQERKGGLKTWNISLITLTFALTIFGTFVTRSGLISSVHAFGVSDLGPLFLGFLCIIVAGSMLLLYLRRSELQNSNSIGSWTAKESSFMLNNLMFIALALGVFIGTILPAITEAISGEKMTVGPPFFNRIATPTGLAIYTLIGVCSLVAWGRTGWSRLGRRFVIPAGIALAITLLLILSGVREMVPLLALAVASFGLSAVLFEFVRDLTVRRKTPGSSSGSFFSRNKRRYSAIILHVGSFLLLIGIIGSSAFNQSRTLTVQKGDTVTLGGYDLRFETLTSEHRQDRHIDAIHFTIFRDGRARGTISSERHFYPNFQPATEVGIRSSLIQDLYLILSDYDKDAGRATVSLLINPLMIWMWIGGIIMTLGTAIALLPESKRGR